MDEIFTPSPDSSYQGGMHDFQVELVAIGRQNPSVGLDNVLGDFVFKVCGTGKLVRPKP